MRTVVWKGKEIDFNAALALMDGYLCNELHDCYSFETDQEFFDEYLCSHEDFYGEEWVFG
jgi:hypothetical protein